MDSLNGKTILITGSNGLIGKNLIYALKESMCNIIALDIAYKDLSMLAKFDKNLDYGNILYLDCDLLDEIELEKSIANAYSKFGSIDGLVNCAAIDSVPTIDESYQFENLDISEFKKVLDVNLIGQVVCTKIVCNLMKNNSIKGSIVNVSSIYGKVSPKQSIYDHIKTSQGSYKKPIFYGVSKSALINATKYLSTYWGSSGIRVNNIILGGVSNKQDQQFIDNYSRNVPLGRMAQVDECIPPILFLLGEESSYVTGSDLVVDGGWTAW